MNGLEGFGTISCFIPVYIVADYTGIKLVLGIKSPFVRVVASLDICLLINVFGLFFAIPIDSFVLASDCEFLNSTGGGT